MLTWTAPGDDGDVGRATAYDVRISTSPIDSTNFEMASIIHGVSPPDSVGANETFIIKGLTVGVRYWFALKTVDEAGNWSGLSNIVSKVAGRN